MSLFDFYVQMREGMELGIMFNFIDSYALLQFDFAGLSDVSIDLDYVTRRARDLWDDVLALWLGLVDKARVARG